MPSSYLLLLRARFLALHEIHRFPGEGHRKCTFANNMILGISCPCCHASIYFVASCTQDVPTPGGSSNEDELPVVPKNVLG